MKHLSLSIALILSTTAYADNVLNVSGTATSTATAAPKIVAKPAAPAPLKNTQPVPSKPAVPAKPAPKPAAPAPAVKAAPVTNVSSTANQSQAQQQSQGQLQTAQGGNATAAGGQGGTSRSASLSAAEANNAGNTTTIEGDTYRAARIPVNTAIAGFQITTASCRYAEGLGVQAVPAAGSVGLTFKDKDCSRAELAQVFYARGADEAGDKLMCQIKLVREALGDDCLTLVHVAIVTPVAAPVDNSQYVTQEELNNVIKRKLLK